MIKLNTSKILVPFDFSATANKAIHHAALLAQANKGEVQLLYVNKQKSILNMGFSTAELRKIAEEKKNFENQLEETAAGIKKKYNVPVKIAVGSGKTISAITRICEKNGIGLIVMGTEGSESVSNLFRGSNSHLVVSHSNIPVITVRSDSRSGSYATLLVPVDLSQHTRQKMIVAIQLAKIFSSRIELLALLNNKDKDDEHKLWAIVKQIEKRLKEERISFDSELIKTGSPARRTIAAAKRKKADLIITMTDQDSGASLLTTRTYDRELVDDSVVPVLSIPPEIHEENIEQVSFGGL